MFAMRSVAAAMLIAAVGSSSVLGQSRWSIEGRAGAALPMKKFADVDLGTGIGFDANVRFRIQEHLHVYGGWDWFHFTADETLPGSGADVEETGYVYGLLFQHPMTERVAYWLRAGGTYDHIEIENDHGDIVHDSKHGAGWEVGAGLAFQLGDRWQTTPGVRMRSLSRDMSIGTGTRSVKLEYVALSLGFVRTF